MDILDIVRLFEKHYPIKMQIDTKEKLWYLLFLVAISGCSERDEIFLGVKHNDREFENYRLAFCRLSQKFESEFDTVPRMTEFVRANYGN
jgi:hypothetical protein